MRKDAVTPELRQAVLERDRGCVAARLDHAHLCIDRWGNFCDPRDLEAATIEHVKSHAMLGRRAPSDLEHCVWLCYDANVVTVWGSAHRPELREYLRSVNERAAA